MDGSLDWHSFIHPKDREIVDTAYAHDIEKNRFPTNTHERHKDGSY